jgi:hypothetical protein
MDEMSDSSPHPTTPAHEIAYQDLVDLMRRHQDLPRLEILAIAANMVGKLLAMQDQRVVTADTAMKVVARNIEAGNAQAIAKLMMSEGSG